ncbi:hypothetical protein [Sphingomonas sp.]|jgi:hypothetical protein|uniref:hypothetical protein n=1 Tax=Sphingomonas sp. TaxID=28214 RepID=UPI002ED979A4
MSFSFSGVLADAGAMWRSHREMLGAIAGVFFLLPILGILFLLAQSGMPDDPDPIKLNEAVRAFYSANLGPILLANLAIDFGTFAVFTLFLQHGDRTLGEVLMATLRRTIPLLAVDLAAAILFGIGMSLLVLPGLFLFGRTWLAAPALAAAPESGVIAAFRQGWRRSAGLNWLLLLAIAAATILVAALIILLGSIPLGVIGAGLGDSRALEASGYFLVAAVGSMAWLTLALARVAAYRRSEPKQGI